MSDLLRSSHRTRRDFLQRLALLGSSLALLPRRATAEGTLPPGIQPCLAQYVFHRTFLGTNGGEKRDVLEFPAMAAELGFTAVDYSGFLWEAQAGNPKFVAELRRRASDAGVRNVILLVGLEAGVLGAPIATDRQQAIEKHTRWIDVTAAIGCSGLRVLPAGDPAQSADERAKLLADGLSHVTEAAASRGLDVLIENHGTGLTSNGHWIARVVRAVNHPRCGTLPDFGNFRRNRARNEWYDRYEGIAAMLPFAKVLGGKANAFDVGGNEIYTDYGRVLRMALDAGFRGFIEVEYEGFLRPGIEPPRRGEAGPELPPAEGALATKRLIERSLTTLYREDAAPSVR